LETTEFLFRVFGSPVQTLRVFMPLSLAHPWLSLTLPPPLPGHRPTSPQTTAQHSPMTPQPPPHPVMHASLGAPVSPG
jgi:hypothetical protein